MSCEGKDKSKSERSWAEQVAPGLWSQAVSVLT